jgi:hypothetical protein
MDESGPFLEPPPMRRLDERTQGVDADFLLYTYGPEFIS